MKLCRFNDDRVGLVTGDRIVDITAEARRVETRHAGQQWSDPLIAGLGELLDSLRGDLSHLESVPLTSARLLSPVFRPGKLVGAPVNYQAHIEEMHASNVSPGHDIPDIKRAGLFLKATSSLVGASEGISQRFTDQRTDHEVELAVVIGRICADVSEEAALDYVAGYALGLDITLRGAADRSFRKSFDSYSVLGPWLTLTDELGDPTHLDLKLTVNGSVRQATNTSDMKLSAAGIIAFASRHYTLYPGDVIFTGTPQGVGPIRPGDILVASCEELGEMQVAVREYPA
jgi:2-keto-4-pentenoate hydratase/2-oxohepta-3-ene-1,7-dioic acid hydratase in catechol pathway